MERHILTVDQQIVNGYPRPHSDSSRATINPQNISQLRSVPGARFMSDERICDRCGTIYKVNSKGQAIQQLSRHHYNCIIIF